MRSQSSISSISGSPWGKAKKGLHQSFSANKASGRNPFHRLLSGITWKEKQTKVWTLHGGIWRNNQAYWPLRRTLWLWHLHQLHHRRIFGWFYHLPGEWRIEAQHHSGIHPEDSNARAACRSIQLCSRYHLWFDWHQGRTHVCRVSFNERNHSNLLLQIWESG